MLGPNLFPKAGGGAGPAYDDSALKQRMTDVEIRTASLDEAVFSATANRPFAQPFIGDTIAAAGADANYLLGNLGIADGDVLTLTGPAGTSHEFVLNAAMSVQDVVALLNADDYYFASTPNVFTQNRVNFSIYDTAGESVTAVVSQAAFKLGLSDAPGLMSKIPAFWQGGETLLVPIQYATIKAALDAANARTPLPKRMIDIVVSGRHSEPVFSLDGKDLAFVNVRPDVSPVEFAVGSGGTVTVAGGAGNYSMTVDIGAHDVVVGDKIYAWSPTYSAGNLANDVHGVWNVVAKTATTLTFKCTAQTSGLATSAVAGLKLIRIPIVLTTGDEWQINNTTTPVFRNVAVVGSQGNLKSVVRLYKSDLNIYEKVFDQIQIQERPYLFIVGSTVAGSLHGISANYARIFGSFASCGNLQHGAALIDDTEFYGRGIVANGNASSGIVQRGGKFIAPRYPGASDVRTMACGNNAGIDLSTLVDVVIANPSVLGNTGTIGMRAQSASRAIVTGTKSVQAYSPALGSVGNNNSIIISE